MLLLWCLVGLLCSVSQCWNDSRIWFIISVCCVGCIYFQDSAVSWMMYFISFALATDRFLWEYIWFKNCCNRFSCRMIVKASHVSIVRFYDIKFLSSLRVSCNSNYFCYSFNSPYKSWILFCKSLMLSMCLFKISLWF